MSIKYSLVPRTSNLADENAKWLIYAAAQSTETVSLQQIAHHMASHNSPFSEGTIIGLLTDFERCVVEQLKRGARVDLGVLGAFYTTLTSRGVSQAADFNPSYIDHINIRWRVSHEMDASMQNTPLTMIANRAEQRKARRLENEKIRRELEEDRKRHANAGD
ncbi:MAG: hypothetical protein J5671_01965 [Bacteroidaceae bacterium]|nr:hypothetical protein [Bacteroidaceae bacterium]